MCLVVDLLALESARLRTRRSTSWLQLYVGADEVIFRKGRGRARKSRGSRFWRIR